ncbi:hypothetical protein GCM10023094_39180 [Rhodococcus olei]|uniref:Uncharacterized protein n=1 Tax=Rhodococcus olei TaxID=2161675 RepID=A0ABP8PDJ1_9NOCA
MTLPQSRDLPRTDQAAFHPVRGEGVVVLPGEPKAVPEHTVGGFGDVDGLGVFHVKHLPAQVRDSTNQQAAFRLPTL